MAAKMADDPTDVETENNTKPAELLNWAHPNDADDDALSARQLIELKKGVRAAIEQDDSILGAPGDLTTEHWNHAGVGVSVYMHRSGVVLMTCEGDSVVTDADTLDHMSLAEAKFFVNPGPATVTSDEV